MVLDKKYEHKHTTILRDIRPLSVRIADLLRNHNYATVLFTLGAAGIYTNGWALTLADVILVIYTIYFLWLLSQDKSLIYKLPKMAKIHDKNNEGPGRSGKAEGILFLGNEEKSSQEVWFTNSDARTHILYLGTTGAGKTEGLKSMVTNALCWGSGFVYVDGKADTDLWSSLSSLVRRFGRDDDLLVLNYMTGNSNVRAPSNTMNPFSSGSASYLTNMLVSLMPESEGDNAMWKERAVALVSALMPVMTWKRDNLDIPMSVRSIRDNLTLSNVIKLARDQTVPSTVRGGLNGYLDTLPGFIAAAYDDNGQVKPPGPDTPQYNTETASQQHGYLAMQFTRALQSLGDDYGYIFDTQAADVDMTDIVLNRRILIVLIPALEKSGDEIANLGKIVAATLKGMMGSTLGSTVEGSSETVIENKPTYSSTPFITVFDEVGYYTVEGMAVMAAQARSLGFSLIFSGQDLPAMKKRVREEANSITANCNIKIFGKLEDPTETKEFFEKTVGSAIVTEVSGYQTSSGSKSYADTHQAGVQIRARADYGDLRGLKEGQAIVTFGGVTHGCKIFYSNPGHAKAMRVTRYIALPQPDENVVKRSPGIRKLRDLMVNKTWTAARADVNVESSPVIKAMADGFRKNKRKDVNPVDSGIASLIEVHALKHPVPPPQEAGAPAEPPPPQTQAPLPAPAPALAPSPTSASAPPPLIPVKAPAAEQKPAETKAGETDPMSFFGKKDAAKVTPQAQDKSPPPAAPPPVQQKTDTPEKPAIFSTSKNQDTILPPAAETSTPSPAAPPQQETKNDYNLPANAEEILKKAASELNKTILENPDKKNSEEEK